MNQTTREIPFRNIPVEQRPLLLVASGVEATTAIREAEDLEHAVRKVLALGIEIGLDASVSFLCEFALESAQALRHASLPD